MLELEGYDNRVNHDTASTKHIVSFDVRLSELALVFWLKELHHTRNRSSLGDWRAEGTMNSNDSVCGTLGCVVQI